MHSIMTAYTRETRRVPNCWEAAEMATPMEADMLTRFFNLDRDMNDSGSFNAHAVDGNNHHPLE